MARILEVKSEPAANKYLLNPFKIGEKVIFISELDKSVQPETFRKQFIKIKRKGSANIEVVSKKIFKKQKNGNRRIN